MSICTLRICTKDDGIRLCISFAVRSYGVSISISHSMSVEFLSCCVLFLFPACFHAFHRNFSFGVLCSNSYIEMPVALRSSAWHSTENVRYSFVNCQGKFALLINGSQHRLYPLHHSFLHVIFRVSQLKNINNSSRS